MHLRACLLRIVSLLSLGLVVGCAHSQPSQVNLGFRSVPDGVLLTRDARIVDENGRFELTAGQPWAVPFDLGDECVLNPDASDPDAALLTGARRVRVIVPDVEEPLYGLLQLCGAPPNATGPATRRYNVEVPQSYVERTAGGLVSVVYEPHQGQFEYGSPKAWSLWLARAPFAPPAPRTEPPVTARSAAQAQANASAAASNEGSGGDDVLLILLLAGATAAAIGGLIYLLVGLE